MAGTDQAPPASTATLDDAMSVGIKRGREESPESLFMPQGGDNDGSEEEHETEQVQLVSGYRSKRRKTERADTPNTLLTAQADEQDDLGTAEIREVESPFTTYHLDMADLEASGSEPVGDLGFREGYPEIAAYHHAFPIVEKRVTGVCDFLITCIEQLRALGWKEDDIEPIYQELQVCRKPSDTYPSPSLAAFFGPTGKGKSSTMNSVLDALRIAYEHSGSNRGTYITHVYMAAPDTQPPGHVAKVYYLDERGVSVQLLRLCGHIVNHLNFEMSSKDGDEDSDDEYDAGEDVSSYEQKYDTALECLHDALCSEEKFATQDKVAKYFRDVVRKCIKSKVTLDGQVATLMADLLPKIEELLASRKTVASVETIEAFDEQAFQRELKRCTRAARPKDLEASPWPFVTKVEIFLKIDVLRDGVIPADLPGVGDKNQRVVENAIRDLKQAGTVLAFAAHDDRLKVNKDLKLHLRTCIDAGKINNIVLVLPKIDTMRELTESERDDLTEEDLADAVAAETRLEEVNAQLETANREQREFSRKGESERFMTGHARCAELELECKAAERSVRQAHIPVRCKRLKEDVASLLKEIDKGKWAPELKVFPISNEQYQLHLMPVDGKAPFLDLETTGIPALRRYLLTAAALGKSERLAHLCLQKLPLLLNGAHGVLTKSPLERKDALRKIIVKTVNGGQNDATDVKTSILAEYERTVMAGIEKKLDRWCVDALMLVTRGGTWAKMHGGTFGAVCNRQGFFKSKKVSTPNHFNRVIFEIVQDGVVEAFDDFGDKYRDVVSNFHSSLKTKLTKLQNSLTEGKMVNLGSFEGFIKGTLADIQQQMDTKFEKLEEIIDRTRRNMILEPSTLYKLENKELEKPNFMVEDDDEDISQDEDDEDTEPRMPVKRHLVGAAMVKVYVDCLSSTRSDPDQGASAKGKRKNKGTKKKGPKMNMHKLRLESMQNSFSSKRENGTTNPDNVFRRMGALAKGRLEVYLEEWATDCNNFIHSGLKKILTNFDKRFQKTEVKTESDKEAVAIFLEALEKASEVVDGELKDLVVQFTSAKKEDKVGDLVSMSQDMSLLG
ncbi:uncharacterized protein CLAFUR5_03347 [Fulvia fulva]|uniref:Uncharacterized protein n=1 Tax=Passalora fulva TaxID=5499 RepID=A0A9Q8LAF8_PASFU|nr:uncharacterized protein CLAFUR5_03347 [Fulvia fulva]KAK4633935.1 hypothetical protein CLAFUR0_03361 [Fulvia fulva]UJO13881.1 hypothetical protein CLAFUR5_03347 [Fulvia fulva]